MSAGRGVMHSEFNHSKTEPLRLLQIWLLPAENGNDPGWEEKTFGTEEKRGNLRLLASPDGADGSLRIHQDVRIHATVLAAEQSVTHDLAAGRHAWIQVARGTVVVNGVELSIGDGAAVSDETVLDMVGVADAEVLVFDLA